MAVLFQKAKAQFPNPLDFNTGTNATNTGTLPIGANDLHWTAAMTNSLGPYVPAVVCGNQAPFAWANSPFSNANWITFPHTCSAGPAEHSCLGNVDEFYKLVLSLPNLICNQSVATPSAYCLSLDFFADNWVSAIYVNNNLSFNNPSPNPYGAMGFTNGGKVTVSLCNNWVAGTNTIIVHVKSGAPNFPGWTGFLAQANQTVNTQIGIPVSSTVTLNNINCFGGNNGTATISTSGATGPYTYTWFPTGGNSSTASNLFPGNYSVTVSSSNGCINTSTFSISQPPQFSLTTSSNTSICNGATLNLQAIGANSYTWSNGSNQQNITVSSPGIYSVSGSNSNGCIAQSSIVVTSGNNPTLTISGSNSICAGSQGTLSAFGALTYSWNNGVNSSSIIINPSVTTVYTVTGTDASGVCFNTATVAINILPAPNVTITGNPNICIGESAILNASGAASYTWNTGSNSHSVVLSPSVTTNYYVYGASAINGCLGTSNALIQVGNYPNLIANNIIICQGVSASLTASGATSYTWSNNTIGNTTTVNPLSNTIYTVFGSGSLPQCVNSQTVLVSIAAFSQINLISSTSKPICIGETVTLTANGSDNYIWSNGLSGSSISITPNATNVYTVNGFNQMNNCVASGTILVSVVSIQTPTIIPEEIMCDGEKIILTAIGSNNYSWSNGASTNTIGITMSNKDVYSVTGFDINSGCSSTSTIELISNETCCQFYIPNTFTPNEDGLNELFGPISLCKFSNYKFSIFNRWGEKIYSTENLSEHWNGYHNGKIVQDGIYVYFIEATKISYDEKSASRSIRLTGHVNVLK